MSQWLDDNTALLTALAIVSVVVFVGSLLVMPILVARIPADYFAHERRPESAWAGQHPVVRVVLLLLKNAAGVLLMLAGLAMLLTPGQGVLTLLAGFLLIDFPGKYRLEQKIVRCERVRRLLNWIRRRKGRAPLVAPRNDVTGTE